MSRKNNCALILMSASNHFSFIYEIGIYLIVVGFLHAVLGVLQVILKHLEIIENLAVGAK